MSSATGASVRPVVSIVLAGAGIGALAYAAANLAPYYHGVARLPATLLHEWSYRDAGALGRHAFRLAFAAGLAWIFIFSGRAMARPLLGESPDPLFAALAAFAVGGGAASYALAWLALAGRISRVTVFAVLVALLLVGVGGMLRRRPSPAAGRGWSVFRQLTPFHFIFAALLAAAALAHLLLALSPPVEIDEMTYHLLGPKHWLQAGGFVEIPSAFHTYLPAQVEMFFLAALALADDVAAKLMESVVWAATGFAVFGLARHAGAGRWPAALSALAFVSMPVVNKCGAAAYVDLSLTFYALLALEAAWRATETRNPRLFYLAFLLTGLAVATKWFGVNAAALVFAGALAAWTLGERLPAKTIGRRLIVGGLFVAAPALPYLLRNFVWTGNPFYPFAGEMFGAPAWAKGSWLSFYTLEGGRWLYASVKDFIFPWFCLAPLLAAAPALWMAANNRRAALLLAVAIAFSGLVALQSPQDRFFFAAFGVLAAVGAAAIDRAPSRFVRACFLAALGAATASNVVLTAASHHDRLPVVVNESLRGQFLARKLPHWEMVSWINERRIPGEVFFLLGIHELYYLDAPFVFGFTPMRRAIDYASIHSPEDFVRRLRELGVTHVVVNRGYVNIPAADRRLKQELRLPADAWTFPAAVYGCVRDLAASPYLKVEQVSSDRETALTRLVVPPA